MHTDRTLEILDETTVQIGAKFRAFAEKTCPSFETRELKREMDARKRRQLKETTAQSVTDSTAGQSNKGARRKVFNLKSYKYHSLGDVANTIRRYGTTDSFSTEPVSSYLFSSSAVDT
jgi:hypothetical protein